MAHHPNPVHPELRAIEKLYPRLVYNRWTVRLLSGLMGLIPANKKVDGVHIGGTLAQSEGSAPPVSLRIFSPQAKAEPLPALLWMHGGGLVIGNARMDDAYLARFVKDLGIVVVSVDYRLAPRHPYPAAIDDCYTALKWVHAQAKILGIDASRIAVGGSSAGGGLAANLAQLAHDRGEVKLAYQLLVYPMLDDRSSLHSAHPFRRWMTWTPQNNRFGWESYLGQPVGAQPVPPYAIAARRTDLSGLPPAWIGVGSLDLFYDENTAYARQMQQCGVACRLEVVEGAFHGFDVFEGHLPVIQKFYESQREALKQNLVAPSHAPTGHAIAP